MQLIGAVAGQQHDGLTGQVPSQVLNQIQRRRIGPVQVLDDQGHRPPSAERRQQLEHALEEPVRREVVDPALPRFRPSQLGDDLGQLRSPGAAQLQRFARVQQIGDGTQRLDEGPVWELGGAQLHARPAEHGAALAGHTARELLDEPRFPDAGVSAEQHHLAAVATECAEETPEPLKLE
ncbi:MAG TPA: hypothetical protein VF365_01485 [Candidatus Limnocylindria bacterium]